MMTVCLLGLLYIQNPEKSDLKKAPLKAFLSTMTRKVLINRISFLTLRNFPHLIGRGYHVYIKLCPPKEPQDTH